MNIKDKNNHYLPYFGNGAYCWPNATAMLLSSIGENISPSLIEVLGGVGLGCCILKGTDYLFFNWELPDAGIDNALKILGFTCKVPKISKTKPTPIEELKPDLKTSPAVLGPLDMGHLVYNPQHSGLSGADHFILVYDINNKNIYLHDPSGFPHVQLSIEKFKLAWRAEKVGYCTKYYRYWAKPKRINIPTKNNIYKSALKLFQLIYQNYQKKQIKKIGLLEKKPLAIVVRE